jgi:putative hydrolase of the HAD superfamily
MIRTAQRGVMRAENNPQRCSAEMGLDWERVATVLLDMDGTLLDLHFDNYFWLEYVPQHYARRHGLDLAAARRELRGRYRAVEGTLQWYCIDFWSRELGLDITALKHEVSHKIAVHARVEPFLEAVRRSGRRLVLVTNAHGDSLDLKLAKTGIGRYFHRLLSAHQLGMPKEDPRFWGALTGAEPYQPDATLLVDDNEEVLRAAARAGIAQLFTMRRPDSRAPARADCEFAAIGDFAELLPIPERPGS